MSYYNSPYAAGVLLYHKSGNNVNFLLGKDVRNKWSDFGGKNEHADQNLPWKTAAREFYEETSGVVFDMYTITELVQKAPFVTGKSYMNKAYFMYLIEVPFKNEYGPDLNIVRIFKNLDPCFLEKTDIKWFNYTNIRNNSGGSVRQVFYETFSTNFSYIKTICNSFKHTSDYIR
jgi:hypothetical protein